jgi:hypothetical protein
MAKIVQVKGHQRRTKKGKIVYVKSHSARKEGGEKKGRIEPLSDKSSKVSLPKKPKTESQIQEVKRLSSLANKRIADKEQAKKVISKYKEYPSNLKLMVDGKWKNVITDVWKTDAKGNRKKMKTVQRQVNFSNKDWEKLIKDNGALIYSVVKKYAFNSEMWDDLKAAAMKSLFEAANNYEVKFNPSNPPDIFKHFNLHMNGMVRWELTKQLATRFQLPPQKQAIYGKFKNAYEEHGGDFNAIYDALKLKRKDLYPALNQEEGEKSLPREGYVTVAKEAVLEKKTKNYENKVNDMKAEYDAKKAALTARFHGGADTDKELFDAAEKEFDRQIKDLAKKMASTKDKSAKVDYADKITEIEKNREQLAREIKPLTEEAYNREMQSLDGIYQRDLQEAKEKFRKDVGKTTIQGAYELFNELEQIMSFKDVNLSKTKEFGDGEKATLESFVRAKNTANPEQEMIIRSNYIKNLDKFKQGLDSLEPKTAKILSLHLGLDDDNELYAHGLWGVPMENTSEIVAALPKDFYPRLDIDTADYKVRLKNWRKRKPTKTITIKRTPAEQKKRLAQVKEWDKRRKKASQKISDLNTHVRKIERGTKLTLSEKRKFSKYLKSGWQNKKNQMKQKWKDEIYKEFKARVADKPTDIMTKQRRLSDMELKALTRKWKQAKPKMELKDDTIQRRVTRDLELGKIALGEIVPKKVYRDLMESYSDMKAYNIRKGHKQDDLVKGDVFARLIGFELEEESIITKAFNKIRSITNKLFG